MTIRVSNVVMRDEEFRRGVVTYLKWRAEREGFSYKRIRYTREPAPKNSRWQHYNIELVA